MRRRLPFKLSKSVPVYDGWVSVISRYFLMYNNLNRSVMNLSFLLGWLRLSFLSDSTIFEDVWILVTLSYRAELPWLSWSKSLCDSQTTKYSGIQPNYSTYNMEAGVLLYRRFQFFLKCQPKQGKKLVQWTPICQYRHEKSPLWT